MPTFIYILAAKVLQIGQNTKRKTVFFKTNSSPFARTAVFFDSFLKG
jgi:hypothetical protein